MDFYAVISKTHYFAAVFQKDLPVQQRGDCGPRAPSSITCPPDSFRLTQGHQQPGLEPQHSKQVQTSVRGCSSLRLSPPNTVPDLDLSQGLASQRTPALLTPSLKCPLSFHVKKEKLEYSDLGQHNGSTA